MEVVGLEVDVGDDSLEESDSDMASAAASDRSSTSAIMAGNSVKKICVAKSSTTTATLAFLFTKGRKKWTLFTNTCFCINQHAFVFRHNKKGLEVIYINAVLRFNLIRSLYPVNFVGNSAEKKLTKIIYRTRMMIKF